MAYEFVLPDFLRGITDVETIHAHMMDILPEDIDKTEAGFPWDITRPSAVIGSEILQYYIPETIKLLFAQWSHGYYLDLLSKPAQIKRKEANHASAILTIKGVSGTAIPAGSVFATEAVAGIPSIEFASESDAEINSEGALELTVRAAEPGPRSNVNAGTIVLMSVPINGVESVTNIKKASGGSEEESDDEFRERIIEANKNMDLSNIGNDADYKRWAEDVPGIGNAIVVSEWNGPETVKIVCVDANGEGANQTLTSAVYNHIMSPDHPAERLAPPNTILTVSSPELVPITYFFNPAISPRYELNEIKIELKRRLEKYYKTINGEVKYIHVHAILASIPGISDFTGLTINGGTGNITIEKDQYPYTEAITTGGDG